jgi:hypothetical protein
MRRPNHAPSKAAVRRLIEARAQGTWNLANEVKAFDLWRRYAPSS